MEKTTSITYHLQYAEIKSEGEKYEREEEAKEDERRAEGKGNIFAVV